MKRPSLLIRLDIILWMNLPYVENNENQNTRKYFILQRFVKTNNK